MRGAERSVAGAERAGRSHEPDDASPGSPSRPRRVAAKAPSARNRTATTIIGACAVIVLLIIGAVALAGSTTTVREMEDRINNQLGGAQVLCSDVGDGRFDCKVTTLACTGTIVVEPAGDDDYGVLEGTGSIYDGGVAGCTDP